MLKRFGFTYTRIADSRSFHAASVIAEQIGGEKRKAINVRRETQILA